MFLKFNEESQRAMIQAKKEMFDLKHPYVGSEHLMLGILKNEKSDIVKKLGMYNITYDNFKNEIIKVIGTGKNNNAWYLYTPLLKRIMETSIVDARENKENEVSILRLVLSLLSEGDGVAIRLLIGMNIDIEEIYNELSVFISTKKSRKKNKLLIEDFAVDFNKRALLDDIDPVIGRDEEINRVIEVLCRRNKNNPLLIGDAGVGKTAIVEELSRRIVSGSVPEVLSAKRILSISMSSLVAGTKYRGEFEERINKILNEVEKQDDIILFIDEIHTLIGAGGAEGAIDASNILKPSLARGKIKVIGATTTDEYVSCLEKDKALDRRFQKIFVNEPDKEKTCDILNKIKNLYEDYHCTRISDEIIELIVDLSEKYIYDRKQPDKAIDILDEVCAKASLKYNKNEELFFKLHKRKNEIVKRKNEFIIEHNFEKAEKLRDEENKLSRKINRLSVDNKSVKTITSEMVGDVVFQKTKIPIFELGDSKIKLIKKLPVNLRKKVFGQDEVIDELTKFTRRKYYSNLDNNIYSFLFVGRTGVGKTYLIREYAKELFGINSFIRLDMSEYKESYAVSKIIGSAPGYVGYDDHGTLLDKVKANPYSIILLDEIEKASKDVINLFLQILDNGKIKNSKGEEINFRNTIIFMTSNLGFNSNSIGFNDLKIQNINEELKNFFSMEFLNRIDKTLVFNDINCVSINKIIKNKLNLLVKDYSSRGISVSYDNKIINEIRDLCEYEKYGARRVDKVISSKINDYIINKVMDGFKDVKFDGVEI